MMTQAQTLEILKTGANVFLSGEPGSGKTHTIREYVRYLRDRGIEPAITASTGIAATHIGGMTIHSWSGIGIKNYLDKYSLDRIASTEHVVKRVRKTNVLIIDEVSMLPARTLTMVNQVLREIKQVPETFGGMQVVFVGDFFQLPPIINIQKEEEENIIQLLPDEPAPRFAFDSPSWARAKLIVCYLSEQHRQDDVEFLSILSAIRRNTFSYDHMKRIETRKTSLENVPKNTPKLFSHNIDVDRINHDMLKSLPGDEFNFPMESRGAMPIILALKKSCLSPENLCLKTGAVVMFTKNNLRERFVNGTLGVVTGFDTSARHPIVRTNSGNRIIVEPMEWSVEENGKVRAQITQFPLRLAWAITVHKSQGMSMDEAIMDLSQVFEYGQGYVALSRVRRLSGLHLLGANERAFLVDPFVLEKDELFRNASGEAEKVFGNLPKAELAQLQKDFVINSGGSFEAARVKTKPRKFRRAKIW